MDIRKDTWLHSGEKVVLDDMVPLNRVSDLIDHSTSMWNVHKIRQLFPPTIAMKIVQTPIRRLEGADEIWWPYIGDGEYFVKSGYH